MGIFVSPNYRGLVEYLARFDIDANRIPVKSINEMGYDYVAQFPDGRPVYHNNFQLTYDPKVWPRQLVHTNVLFLLAGGSLQDIKPDDVIEEEQPKEVDDAANPPTPKEKLETPAESKPRTVRKKVTK